MQPITSRPFWEKGSSVIKTENPIASQGTLHQSGNGVPSSSRIVLLRHLPYPTFLKQQTYVLSVWVQLFNKSVPPGPSQYLHRLIQAAAGYPPDFQCESRWVPAHHQRDTSRKSSSITIELLLFCSVFWTTPYGGGLLRLCHWSTLLKLPPTISSLLPNL